VIDIADDGCTPEEIEDGKLFQALRKQMEQRHKQFIFLLNGQDKDFEKKMQTKLTAIFDQLGKQRLPILLPTCEEQAGKIKQIASDFLLETVEQDKKNLLANCIDLMAHL